MNQLNWTISAPDAEIYQSALARQSELTKPQGSLGRLEEIAVRLAAIQKTQRPSIDPVWITVFAGDHGITEESVSAFPQAVTREMVRNFHNGGAAINVLADQIGAELEIVDTGMVTELVLDRLIIDRAGPGTGNFIKGPAMSLHQLQQALHAGRRAVERAYDQGAQLFIGGEMGIGNTTSAAATACALGGFPPGQIAGTGTGLDEAGRKRKQAIIRQALALHKNQLNSVFDILQCLGGYEIAALTGAYLTAAEKQLPVLVDGFITTVAAYCAAMHNPDVQHWLFYAHKSAEQGHQVLLDRMSVKPLLDLDMRLGEGSGAAVAVALLRSACLLHNGMATFVEARVSTA